MKIQLVSSSSKRRPSSVFIAAHFEGEKISKNLHFLEPGFAKIAQQALDSGRFQGKFAETLISFHPEYREAPEILLIGLGKKKNYKKKCLRKISGTILGWIKDRKMKKARIALESLESPEIHLTDVTENFTEIAHLASYTFDKYKSKKDHEKPLSSVLIEGLCPAGKLDALKKNVEVHTAISEGVILARNLINEPANIMHPQKLAASAREMARTKKIHCKILEKSELEKLKMGGILAVNQGSVIPPALIILEHGRAYQSKGTICLIGKGVTFDTGGISIKPSKDMEKMKYDMSGAAAMIATLGVLADLKVQKHVIALAPAVENNVAEDPQRPGDIITMYNGKTVEVINTDAEGRLILGDALAYSEKFKPKAIIDAATLTGMAAATFGDQCIAILGNDERLIERVRKAGEETGERCWELPMWDEYFEQIKGHHSDLYNVGGGYGGTITAAKFLEQFVPEKTPWVHLDIAGVAWANTKRFDCPKGGTGAAVRLLVHLISNWK